MLSESMCTNPCYSYYGLFGYLAGREAYVLQRYLHHKAHFKFIGHEPPCENSTDQKPLIHRVNRFVRAKMDMMLVRSH